jgi:8-oxo-dGTP pyrophosphatase MutT (NUDIX family)
VSDALRREVLEEVGLGIEVGDLEICCALVK